MEKNNTDMMYNYNRLRDDISANTGLEHSDVADKINKILSKKYDGLIYDLSQVNDDLASKGIQSDAVLLFPNKAKENK